MFLSATLFLVLDLSFQIDVGFKINIAMEFFIKDNKRSPKNWLKLLEMHPNNKMTLQKISSN